MNTDCGRPCFVSTFGGLEWNQPAGCCQQGWASWRGDASQRALVLSRDAQRVSQSENSQSTSAASRARVAHGRCRGSQHVANMTVGTHAQWSWSRAAVGPTPTVAFQADRLRLSPDIRPASYCGVAEVPTASLQPQTVRMR